jgi:hypothetical protein
MARIADMHKKWMKKSKYRKAYEALEEEFALASPARLTRSRLRAASNPFPIVELPRVIIGEPCSSTPSSYPSTTKKRT